MEILVQQHANGLFVGVVRHLSKIGSAPVIGLVALCLGLIVATDAPAAQLPVDSTLQEDVTIDGKMYRIYFRLKVENSGIPGEDDVLNPVFFVYQNTAPAGMPPVYSLRVNNKPTGEPMSYELIRGTVANPEILFVHGDFELSREENLSHPKPPITGVLYSNATGVVKFRGKGVRGACKKFASLPASPPPSPTGPTTASTAESTAPANGTTPYDPCSEDPDDMQFEAP
jgi:hypothetical protein